MESRFDNFIAGDWVPGEHYQPNINPSCTSDVIGEYVQASIKQTQSALHAAADAFAVWSTCSIQQRCDARFRAPLSAQIEELTDAYAFTMSALSIPYRPYESRVKPDTGR